jgi:hypothetical protein
MTLTGGCRTPLPPKRAWFMDALKVGINHEGELAAHSIRVLKRQRMKCAQILHDAITGAGFDESPAEMLKRRARCRGQGQMVEMSAIKHARTRDTVWAGGNLDRVQPGILAYTNDRVTKRRCCLTEDYLQPEDARVEVDEAVEIGCENCNVIQPGQKRHQRHPLSEELLHEVSW